MGTMIALLGLMLGAWAVRSICLTSQILWKRICQSVIAAWYFLAIGGLGGTQEDKIPIAVALMLVGAAVVWFLTRRANAADRRE